MRTLASCFIRMFLAAAITLPLAGCMPRNYKFAKNPFNLRSVPATLLDTASVYVAFMEAWSPSSPTGVDTLRVWYRFFSNERVYIGQTFGRDPTESEVNTLYDAPYPSCESCVNRHFYTVEGNEVTLEMYLNRLDGFRYRTATIYPDSLVVYRIRTRASSWEEIREVYIRTPYRLTNYDADW